MLRMHTYKHVVVAVQPHHACIIVWRALHACTGDRSKGRTRSQQKKTCNLPEYGRPKKMRPLASSTSSDAGLHSCHYSLDPATTSNDDVLLPRP